MKHECKRVYWSIKHWLPRYCLISCCDFMKP